MHQSMTVLVDISTHAIECRQSDVVMLRCAQVESYTLQYASSLTSGIPTCWAVAAQYLAWCPVMGAGAMRTLLQRVPIAVRGAINEQEARRVLRCCRLYNLPGGPQPVQVDSSDE